MLRRLLPLSLLVFAVGCASSGSDDTVDAEGRFSSNQATLLDLEFDAEMTTDDTSWLDEKDQIFDQLLYTIGHLNWNSSVGRLDDVTLTNVQSSSAGGVKTIRYHAKLPVAWGSKTDIPTSYEFRIPKDLTAAGQKDFTAKYKDACVDFGAHDVDADSMWYYYRPQTRGCGIDAADVLTIKASAVPSKDNTTGRYPEYDRVWEDNQLNVVAVFGKYEEGQTVDNGIDAYNDFIASVQGQLSGATVTPATAGRRPGPAATDVTIEATLPGGRSVKVTALLVDKITSAPPTFWQRYEELSPNADMIAYNGHAGLGQNVRELASRGKWVKGKYVIIFMNGCDTFAYVDGSLAETRAKFNSDDPRGTKYMEFVTNAMPSFFNSMAQASFTLVQGLLKYDAPQTYDQIFENVDGSQVILVTGEEDNTYKP
jgi:hypothetical protein